MHDYSSFFSYYLLGNCLRASLSSVHGSHLFLFFFIKVLENYDACRFLFLNMSFSSWVGAICVFWLCYGIYQVHVWLQEKTHTCFSTLCPLTIPSNFFFQEIRLKFDVWSLNHPLPIFQIMFHYCFLVMYFHGLMLCFFHGLVLCFLLFLSNNVCWYTVQLCWMSQLRWM